MSQCVPSWDIDDATVTPPRLALRAHSNSSSLAPDVPSLDYEVAELTWENGQLSLHGLGPPRVPSKPAANSSPAKYAWDKPRAAAGTGTLESIVNQATHQTHLKTIMEGGVGGGDGGDDVVPWFDHRNDVAAASFTATMDALVPCSNSARNDQESFPRVPGVGTGVVGCSTRVGSCSGAATFDNARDAALARVGFEWSSRADTSASGSATCGKDSRQITLDTCEREAGTGAFTSTSLESPGNTSSTKAKTVDDHDSAFHSKPQRVVGEEEEKRKGKSSGSTKRSRAAAIHNQSERKRRDKINQKMKTLQKLVPNSSKTDKASMLDEVIEYLKQLQAQVQMMNRMNMSPGLMLPLAMQQQLHMSMMPAMAGMGMGMGMGMNMGMDMNSISRSNVPTMPPMLHPSAFMPLTSWENPGDRLPSPASMFPDPMAAFLACQSQPMTMDAYTRMAALFQQLQQPPGPGNSKN